MHYVVIQTKSSLSALFCPSSSSRITYSCTSVTTVIQHIDEPQRALVDCHIFSLNRQPNGNLLGINLSSGSVLWGRSGTRFFLEKPVPLAQLTPSELTCFSLIPST